MPNKRAHQQTIVTGWGFEDDDFGAVDALADQPAQLNDLVGKLGEGAGFIGPQEQCRLAFCRLPSA